nr:hypothetical protein [Nanoarchaeum sp.]
MKIMVIVLILLVLPICFAKEVNIIETFESEKNIGETTYYYAGAKLIATKNNDNINYEYQDRLDSDVESDSLPFGEEVNSNERFSFTGKELDEELYYFNARYYDSKIGRFTSVDPVPTEPAYQYVQNNPTNLFDSTGSAGTSVRNKLIDVNVFIINPTQQYTSNGRTYVTDVYGGNRVAMSRALRDYDAKIYMGYMSLAESSYIHFVSGHSVGDGKVYGDIRKSKYYDLSQLSEDTNTLAVVYSSCHTVLDPSYKLAFDRDKILAHTDRFNNIKLILGFESGAPLFDSERLQDVSGKLVELILSGKYSEAAELWISSVETLNNGEFNPFNSRGDFIYFKDEEDFHYGGSAFIKSGDSWYYLSSTVKKPKYVFSEDADVANLGTQ